MRSALNSSEEIEKFLGQYSHFGAPVKDLSRFSVLMNELGNPQDSLRYIHIVGTNGKGSTAEFCTSALAAAGFAVGRFTSPYVSSICERIAVAYPDGLYKISAEDFSRLLYTAADAAAKFPELEFSQFEIMNAAAFLYYAEKRVDYVVLEAGIGGTLDSTNIIRQPECAVITSIGLDHTKILGDTVEKIARSKCGVIKGGNAVAGEDIPASAMEVLRERCAEVGARLIVPDSAELSVHSTGLEGSSFAYRGQEYRLRMGGEYQIRNAMTAIEVLLGMGISPAAISMGLSRAQVPARMELFRSNSPGRPSVLLDGGHNPQAGCAVRAAHHRRHRHDEHQGLRGVPARDTPLPGARGILRRVLGFRRPGGIPPRRLRASGGGIPRPGAGAGIRAEHSLRPRLLRRELLFCGSYQEQHVKKGGEKSPPSCIML